MEYQPQPLSAMEMIQREPIRLSTERITPCDGGEWQVVHPQTVLCSDVLTSPYLPRQAMDHWDTHACSSTSTSLVQRHAHTGEHRRGVSKFVTQSD